MHGRKKTQGYPTYRRADPKTQQSRPTVQNNSFAAGPGLSSRHQAWRWVAQECAPMQWPAVHESVTMVLQPLVATHQFIVRFRSTDAKQRDSYRFSHPSVSHLQQRPRSAWHVMIRRRGSGFPASLPGTAPQQKQILPMTCPA